MKRGYQMLVDIWDGLKFAFRTAPVPAIFLTVWVAYLVWAVANYK